MAPSTTNTPASTEPTPRPSSRGAFELHVQSVRAARGLPHLVHVQPAAPTAPSTAPPQYVVPTLPSPAYRPYDDEKSTFERDSDAGSVHIIVGEAKSNRETPLGNRQTMDDGPEPKTLSRALFLYGFLMPLFWAVGASILFLDLAYHQTPEEVAEDPRTPEERAADLRVLRRAEVRWAWRSLYALINVILIVGFTLLIWAGATGRFTGLQNQN